MDPKYYGLIEMALSFGTVLGFCFWQLYQLRRPTVDDRAKPRDEP